MTVWHRSTKAAVEHIQHIPGSQWAACRNNHGWQQQNCYLQLKHTSKCLKLQWLFILNLKPFTENFQKFPFAEQTWLPPPEVSCTISTQPNTHNKSDYFSLKSWHKPPLSCAQSLLQFQARTIFSQLFFFFSFYTLEGIQDTELEFTCSSLRKHCLTSASPDTAIFPPAAWEI